MKPRAFYFHYNKPATLQNGKVTISVHYMNRCLLVDNIVCYVPTKGRISPRQPRFVVAGKAAAIEIVDSVAYIT